jgi:hypothetical protein
MRIRSTHAIKNKQYRAAADAIDDVVRLQPEYLPAWKAKIWLATVMGDTAALPAMRRLAKLLGSQPSDIAETPQYRQAADFLGRICGYLAGPARAKPDLSTRAADVAQIFVRLTRGQQVSFLEGRQAVLSQFTALSKEIRDLRQEAVQTAELVRALLPASTRQ